MQQQEKLDKEIENDQLEWASVHDMSVGIEIIHDEQPKESKPKRPRSGEL